MIAGAGWWFFGGGALYTPPEEPADERFGFLGSPDPGQYKMIRDTGAAWVRPHPGPFIWGNMQKEPNSKIDFMETDDLIKQGARYDLNILVTLWPYAEWDQLNRSDSDKCKVNGEEFNYEFGPYRCNPKDWQAYEIWVKTVVERYDGDGTNDMPELVAPITHWEVFNEPDLQGGPEGSLQFFVGEPEDYAELLKHTYNSIKSADSSAKVLISGAAGGNSEFLDFYRKILEDETVKASFDIANVHCISNDDFESFNVEPYKKMLSEFGINKPIWVTEAESYISDDPQINVTQLKASTKRALELGAEKIFYTGMDLKNPPGGAGSPKSMTNISPDQSLNANNPQEAFQTIFNSL